MYSVVQLAQNFVALDFDNLKDVRKDKHSPVTEVGVERYIRMYDKKRTQAMKLFRKIDNAVGSYLETILEELVLPEYAV